MSADRFRSAKGVHGVVDRGPRTRAEVLGDDGVRRTAIRDSECDRDRGADLAHRHRAIVPTPRRRDHAIEREGDLQRCDGRGPRSALTPVRAGSRQGAGNVRTMLEPFQLTDQVAIVTGGGKGIGAATAALFAQAGADVVVTARLPRTSRTWPRRWKRTVVAASEFPAMSTTSVSSPNWCSARSTNSAASTSS